MHICAIGDVHLLRIAKKYDFFIFFIEDSIKKCAKGVRPQLRNLKGNTMDVIKIIGVGLISLIIIIIVRQYKPEFTLYVSLLAGALILVFIMDKISGIIDLLTTLSNKTAINNDFLVLLIKITGIAFLTEFAVSICKDSGETAIASKVDMGGKVIIVSMSIPIISSLLETVIEILP